MEQTRMVGIRNYIVAGTGFEYGRSGERYEQIPTDAPLEPTITYPASWEAWFVCGPGLLRKGAQRLDTFPNSSGVGGRDHFSLLL